MGNEVELVFDDVTFGSRVENRRDRVWQSDVASIEFAVWRVWWWFAFGR